MALPYKNLAPLLVAMAKENNIPVNRMEHFCRSLYGAMMPEMPLNDFKIFSRSFSEAYKIAYQL
jgi:hypothetical protein